MTLISWYETTYLRGCWCNVEKHSYQLSKMNELNNKALLMQPQRMTNSKTHFIMPIPTIAKLPSIQHKKWLINIYTYRFLISLIYFYDVCSYLLIWIGNLFATPQTQKVSMLVLQATNSWSQHLLHTAEVVQMQLSRLNQVNCQTTPTMVMIVSQIIW